MFKLHFNPSQALQQWVQQKSVAKRPASNNTYTRDNHDARNVTVNSVPLTSSEFHADRELPRGASNVATESELVPPPCLSLRAKNSGPELRMPQRHPRARVSLRYWGSAIPVAANKRERHSLGARVAAALVQEHKACSSPERKENENKDRLTASFASSFCTKIIQKGQEY